MVSDENKLYVFPYEKLSPELNMAMDHSIAHSFNMHNKSVLRFYGWKPYAISYGFHQKVSEFNLELIKKKGFEIVRRPTGGRAIFHAHELTYSIIVAKSKMSKFDLYRKTHHAFSEVIKNFSSNVALSKKQINFGDFYKEKKSAACFAASARFEVALENKKLIGSAQRIYDDAILQHGSIMLSNDHLDLLNFLNLNAHEKEEIRLGLSKSTSFLDLKKNNLTIQDLCERFLDCIVKEIEFNSVKKSSFEDLNIDLVALR